MFRTLGSMRTHRQNTILAGSLAVVAGYVNAMGFVVFGIFTSHATGNVGRFAHELASAHFAAAGTALLLVGSFFGGAFVASMVIESTVSRRTPRAYGIALSLEALLLCAFALPSPLARIVRSGLPTLESALLCTAMGIQNSLVTRLSGAVVRTTHLTGVLTDLGIETARWLRWRRISPAFAKGVTRGDDRAEHPSPAKLALLGTIAVSFTVGAVAGTTATLALGCVVALAPSLALASAAAYAFATRDQDGSAPPPRSR